MKKRSVMIALLFAVDLAAVQMTGCGSTAETAVSTEVSAPASETEESLRSAEGFLYMKTESDTAMIMGLDPDSGASGDSVMIPATIDGLKVTSIGACAFRGNLSIQSVTLPDTIISIEAHAFDDCSELKTINLPEGLKSIGDGVFFCCTRLKEVIFPASLQSIGKGAFYDCGALKEITLPNGFSSLGSYAFYGCSGLTRVTLNEGLTEVGRLSFMKCEGLKEITLPSTLTAIDDHAFDSCTALTSVILPEKLKTIGDSAFENCGQLNQVKITAESVGSQAFYNCYGLTELTICSGVESLGDQCFTFSAISTLKIPASVREIGEEFAAHTSIASYETEEDGAFISVDGVLFNSDMTRLVSYPFMKEGESYTVPDGVTEIAAAAFADSSLTSITLPDGLLSIGDKAFRYVMCDELVLPDSLKSLGDSSFTGCMKLTSITLPDGIEDLPDNLFDGDAELKDITFPSNLTSIGAEVFRDCWAYTTFKVPDTVTDMDPLVDRGSNISAFEVSDKSLHYSVKDGVLFSKDGKKLINFPAASENAGTYTVPDGTESIGSFAFACQTYEIDSVILADSVTTLDPHSLVDVEQVTADAALTEIGEGALGYGYNQETLEIVPANGFILYGQIGSAAERYADSEDLAFASGKMKLSDKEIILQMGQTKS